MKSKDSQTESQKESNSTQKHNSEQRSAPKGSKEPPIQEVHHTMGNQAVQREYEDGCLQAKMTVSQPSDNHEQEAKRIAEEVIQAEYPTVEGGEDERTRGSVDPVVDINTIQTKSVSGSASLNSELEEQIRLLDGGGRPLRTETRSFFEPRFGRDFDDVRIHTGPKADEAARSINAEAFTYGTDVVFRNGRFNPDSQEGKQLLAHELTHVVQQDDGSSSYLELGLDASSEDTVHRQESGYRPAKEYAPPAASGEAAKIGANRGPPKEVKKIDTPSFTEILEAGAALTARGTIDILTFGLSEKLRDLAHDANVTIALGPELDAIGAVAGGAIGYGIVFFPDRTIGAYGDIAALHGAGISGELSGTVTVVDGDIRTFTGSLKGVSVSGGWPGTGGAVEVTLMFPHEPGETLPDDKSKHFAYTREFVGEFTDIVSEDERLVGVSVEAGVGASLSVVDVFLSLEGTTAKKLLGDTELFPESEGGSTE